MPQYDYDLFTIGAGSGGVRASRVAAAHGARVGIAEDHKIGGTCVIRGCVPKKLLVYGAHFAEDIADARRFGWDVGTPKFSWATLRDNVLEEVTRLEGLYTQTLVNNGVAIHNERARVVGLNEVELAGGRRVTAGKILLATGAWPIVPDVPGAEHGITSNEAFHLDELPDRVTIAGAGYIANEFAGIFNQLGCEVTILNRSDQFLRGYDQAIRDRLMQISTLKGIRFQFNAPLQAIEKDEAGMLHVHTGGHRPLKADLFMFATGRMPNTGNLGLEEVGVRLNDKGAVVVDEDNRSTCPSIFAVGDITDRVQLTPVAIREGQAFADTQFGGRPTRVDYHCIPSAVFSHPPMAGVGMTESDARRAYGSVKVYSSDFRAMRDVLAGRNERALFKMVVDGENEKVVGLHMIGPDAPEILQAAAIAVKAGLSKADFDATVALHPSMAEELVLLK